MSEATWPLDVGQMLITDFFDGAHVNVQQVIEDKLKLKVQWHLAKFVKLYLKWLKTPQNLEVFHAYIDESLVDMEAKEICFFKTMPDGGTYLFKRAFRYCTLEQWKKCPWDRCLIEFPCCDLCPYDEFNWRDLNAPEETHFTEIEDKSEEDLSKKNEDA